MDRRLSEILQIMSLAVLAWFAYSLLGRVHWLLSLALTILAMSNSTTIWMLRSHPRWLAFACRRRFLARYVRCVCYFTGDQPPVRQSTSNPAGGLLLHSRRDFEIAGGRARAIVRGHDHVIDGMLARVHENLTLRKSRRDGSSHGPLASFLLVGDDGVGKRYLTRVLAKLLYQGGGVEVFECDGVSSDLLIGTKGTAGALLEAVRRQPHTTVLFERIDAASRDVVKVLTQLLTTGRLRPPGSDTDVSFQCATVFLTTTKGALSLATLAHQGLCGAAWQQRAMEEVGRETLIDHSLLNAVTDMYFCQPPTDLVKAEVAALLMKKECGAHGVELCHVEPEILAAQVLQVDGSSGFGPAPQQVKKLLRKPLVAAAEQGRTSLSLRVRVPARLDAEEISQR